MPESKDFEAPVAISSRRSFIAASMALLVSPAYLSCNSTTDPEPAKVVESLRRSFDGELLFPSSERYETARLVAGRNRRFDRRPLVIAYCASEADIQRCLEQAVSRKVPLAVRCGGHDVLGASTCDAGILLDLSRLRSMTLNREGKRLTVGSGVRAGAVTSYLSDHGRVAALGCNPTVGLSGLALGGGLGWFLARHGATCDTVSSARVVTPDGLVRAVGPHQEEDLFWAIRGGGGNFGVVSQWELATFEQGRVTAGAIVYEGEGKRLRDFLEFYREQHLNPTEDLTVEVVGIGHRSPIVAAAFVYAGRSDKADSVLEPWMRFGPPLAVEVATAPLAQHRHFAGRTQPFFAWPGDPMPGEQEEGSYWQGAGIADLSDAAIDILVSAVGAAPFGWSWGLGHFLTGKAAKPDSPTAFFRRPRSLSVHFDGGWERSARAEPLQRWVDGAVAELDRLPGTGDYLNYLSTEAPERIRQTFGPSYRRLLQVKRRFDPENTLRRNRNIDPAPAE